MTMTKKQRKRAATAGAALMMLGVLHLSTKDASGTELCEVGHANPPIVAPCAPGATPPPTVVYNVTPYQPGDHTLPPPVEGKPVGVPTLPPTTEVTPPTAVTTTTEAIQEDQPGWDCHTMGNKQCGPSKTKVAATHRTAPAPLTTLPATS